MIKRVTNVNGKLSRKELYEKNYEWASNAVNMKVKDIASEMNVSTTRASQLKKTAKKIISTEFTNPLDTLNTRAIMFFNRHKINTIEELIIYLNTYPFNVKIYWRNVGPKTYESIVELAEKYGYVKKE